MDATTWGKAWNDVAKMLITLFNYAFQVLGAATTTLIALTILAAIFRLILMPLLGYNNVAGFLSQKVTSYEFKQRHKKERNKAERKNADK